MRILTYTTNCTGLIDDDPKAITQEQWDSGMRLPDDYADYIWHENAPSIEWAIANHFAAYDAYQASENGIRWE